MALPALSLSCPSARPSTLIMRTARVVYIEPSPMALPSGKTPVAMSTNKKNRPGLLAILKNWHCERLKMLFGDSQSTNAFP
jgi:hypothetical protein